MVGSSPVMGTESREGKTPCYEQGYYGVHCKGLSVDPTPQATPATCKGSG